VHATEAWCYEAVILDKYGMRRMKYKCVGWVSDNEGCERVQVSEMWAVENKATTMCESKSHLARYIKNKDKAKS